MGVEPMTFQNTFGHSNHLSMEDSWRENKGRTLGSYVWQMSCHICKAQYVEIMDANKW